MQTVNPTLAIIGTRYGARRPLEIAAKVAALRAQAFRAPVATIPTIEAPQAPAAPQTLVPWVSLYPRQRDEHLRAQRRFYAAIKAANLPLTMSVRLDGINALLGTRFTSSTQLSPDELRAVSDAIESGRFTSNWTLDDVVIDDDAPLPDAPPESESAPGTVGTPASLESLDWLAVEYDLAQMRAADRARALNALRSERVLLETRLREVDHAILTA